MKTKIINVLLVLVILTGLAIVLHYQIRTEEKERIRDIYIKGKHLVSLMALHPISAFEGDQNYFLRTLVEYSTKEGLVYCNISKADGVRLVSFELSQDGQGFTDCKEIYKVRNASIAYNSSEKACNNGRVYEFTKPLYENGDVAGTIKIGLMLTPLAVFTKERISMVGMLFFFIIASILLVYFGILQAIQPISSMFSNQESATLKSVNKSEIGRRIGGDSIYGIMQEFQTSMGQLNKELKNVISRNKDLSFQIGVVKFEKNQVQNIINKINFGIVILDIQDNVVQINDYMLKQINQAREAVIDQPVESIFTDSALIDYISPKENSALLQSNIQLELSLSEHQGKSIYSISCTILSGEEKQLAGKLITFSDITSQKEAEENTIAFVAHLSHELMTPLTTIQSYSEMLMEGEIEDTETQKEFYNTINKETDRLTRLIKDLLSLSRIEMGGLNLNKDIINSESLFQDCLVSVEGSAKKKGISIEQHVPDNFPNFMGDKDLLKGAIINILGNAVKYTPEKGRLDFGIRQKDDSLIFDISDTGYGMSEADLGHIFEKFYRSSNPDVAEKQGTGLGLCIASEIIALHGGKIDVQSELGKGTYFIISIPIEEYYIDQ